MIKKLLLGLLLLAVLALGAVYFFGTKALNSGVKKGVETIGPRVTQTTVTLDSVDLSPLSGSGSLKGLIVGNPDGFKSDHIFKLGQIDVVVDLGSITSDTIVIEKIHILEPGISYEKKLTTSNIRELQKNIEAFTGPKTEAPAEGATDTAPRRQLVIQELIIEDGSIFVGVMGAGQTVPLPRIEMSNLGEEGTRANIGEILNEVLKKVLTSVGPAIANAGQLTEEAANALKTQGLEAVDQAAGKAGEAVNDAANEAGKAVSDGLNKLFK